MITVDGYYIEIVICAIIGFIWYGVYKNLLKNFQTKSSSYWMVHSNSQSKPITQNLNDVVTK